MYIEGNFVGGLDVVKEMVANGEFQDILPKEDDLNTRLSKLINKHQMMLFMKGNPATPKCGFSRVLVQLLQEHNCDFKT